jgi:hypothetical protein
MSERSAKGRGAGLQDYLFSDKAREGGRKEGDSHSWTRDRKLPLPNLVVGILGQAGLTGAMEVRRIFEAEGKSGDEAVSNQDYLARRRLLNPRVFRESNRVYLSSFYRGEEAKCWKGYLVMAADGSQFEVANSKENQEKYGSEAKAGGRAAARCLYGALSDVLNGFILYISPESIHSNERREAEENIEGAWETTGGRPAVILFDRNYASLELIEFLEERGIKYIIRLKNKAFKAERESASRRDETVNIEHTKARVQHIKRGDPETALKLEAKGSTEARIIKMDFADGEGAVMTNLERSISGNEIKKLYRKRWGIEEQFNTLKNKMRGEYTAGKSASYVEQDFWASVVVHNIIHDMINAAKQRLARKNKHKKLKYKYHINENMAIGLFKQKFVNLVMEQDNNKRLALYKELWAQMERYTLPYRHLSGRPRKWNTSNKYKCNLKPSY